MARLSKKPQPSRDKTSSNKERGPLAPKKSNNTKDEPKLMNCSIKVKKIKATYETEMDPSTRSVKRAAEKADVQKVTRIPRTIVKPMKYRDGSNDENKKIKLTQLSDSKKQAEKIADKPAVTKKLKQEVAKEIIEQPVAQTRTRAKKDDEKILYQQKAASKQDSNKISIPTVEPASKKNNLKKTKNDDKSPPAKDVPADIPESLPRASRTKIVPLRFRLDEKKPKEMLAPSINPIQVQPKIELKKMQPRIELKKVQPRIQLRKVIVSPEKTVKIVSALEVGFESRNETTPLKKSPAKPILLRTSTKKSPAKLILLRSSTKKSDSIARKLYTRKQPPKMQALSENLDQRKKPVLNVPKMSEVVKSSKRTLDKAAPQPQSKRLKPTSVSIFNKPKVNFSSL